MTTVFISYARTDGSDAARRLHQEIERAGFPVWQDVQDMRGGAAWKEQLRDAIQHVDVVVVLLTPRAVASRYVTWEWESAITLKKRVIPVLILLCDIPADLTRMHYHDLSQPEKYTDQLLALIRDLHETPAAMATTSDPSEAEEDSITLQSRLMALDSRLQDLRDRRDRGRLDEGRYADLAGDLERERNELALRLQKLSQ